MWKLKNKIRAYVKRVYHKLNPQYKYILHMNDVINSLEIRMTELEKKTQISKQQSNSEIEKLFLASDPIVYRYLYLKRYIRENDRVLDIEGQYGAGADLLEKYTAIDTCLCLNSINYYTELGKKYYQSDSVKFQTGSFKDVDGKFDLICFFEENKSVLLRKDDIKYLIEMLEVNGILAIAWENPIGEAKEFLEKHEEYGVSMDKIFYQNHSDCELTEEMKENASIITYFRKNE